MPDHSGLGDHRHDVGRAAGDVLRADRPREHPDAVDAVLKGHDECAGPDERRKHRRAPTGVVELHREEHDVHRTDGRRIVGGLDAPEGVTLPIGLSMRRPRAHRVPEVRPRARNATSVPAAASRPP